mgnify:CR=1 FL=1|tara:strand:- start:9905 stop:10333 length:429 start_codon:yes stop_codon:yes gene_type:complete
MSINKYKNISFNNVIRVVNIFILSNYAKLGPPLSIILSYYKIKPIDFINQFNEETKKKFLNKLPLKVTIYLYKDKSFKYVLNYPSVSFLIKNILKLKNKNTLNYLDIYKIALIKQIDMPNIRLKNIFKTIISTIFSMKINIK